MAVGDDNSIPQKETLRVLVRPEPTLGKKLRRCVNVYVFPEVCVRKQHCPLYEAAFAYNNGYARADMINRDCKEIASQTRAAASVLVAVERT